MWDFFVRGDFVLQHFRGEGIPSGGDFVQGIMSWIQRADVDSPVYLWRAYSSLSSASLSRWSHDHVVDDVIRWRSRVRL